MMLVGLQEHTKLLTIMQRIEIYEKTGLLIITQREQRIELSVQQGQIMSVEPLQGHGTLWNRLLQAGAISRHDLQVALDTESIPYNQFTSMVNCSEMEMALTLKRLRLASHEQLYDWVRQEAIGIIRVLLTWSEAEIRFEEGVQPPKDRFPLALHISSLLPSLAISNLSNKDFTPLIGESSTPLTPFPTIFKSPKLDLEEKGAPIALLPVTPFPTDFNSTTLSQESAISSSTPDVIFPLLHDSVTPKASQPHENVVLQSRKEKREEVTCLPDASSVDTLVHRAKLPLAKTRLIHILHDSVTPKASQPHENVVLQSRKEKREEVTCLPDASSVDTLVHRAIVPLAIARLIQTSSDDAFTAKYPTPRQSQSSVTQWPVFLIAASLLIAALAFGASKLVPSPRVSIDSSKSAGPELGSLPQQFGSSKLLLSSQTYVDGTKIEHPEKEVVITTNKPIFFGYALSNVIVTLTIQSTALRRIMTTDGFRRMTTTDSNGYWIFSLDDPSLHSQVLPPGAYKLYLTQTDHTGSSSGTPLAATFKVPVVLPNTTTTVIVPAPSLLQLNYFTVSLLIFGVVGVLVLVYSTIKCRKVNK